MAVDEARFRELLNAGVPVGASRVIADPDLDSITSPAVPNVGAVTSTDVAAANAAVTSSAAYVQAESTALATLGNENKADFNLLRADLLAVRTQLNLLLASLRAAGVILP